MTVSEPPPDPSTREKHYREAYLTWVSSLDPRDRATLKEMGLDRPKVETTALVWARPENFRDSTATAGYQDGLAESEFVHPGDSIDEPEDGATDIDESELAKLGCYDGEIIACILRVLFFPPMGRRGVNLSAAFHRLIAVAHCLKVEGVGDRSLENIAVRIGSTRSILSHFCVKIRDHAGLDHRGGKSAASRQRLATAHLWIPGSKTRHRKKAPALPGIDTESQAQTDHQCADQSS
jgi:hypothetical protein